MDLGEARRMFSTLPHVTFVTGNRGPSSYIDMQLMSLCKHNIIANSGFSSFAAWLNANTNKLVIGSGNNTSIPGYIRVKC